MAQVSNGGRVRACPHVGSWDGRKEHRLRLGSWNIGTLMGKSIKLVKILRKRKVNIACVQEAKWTGAKARDIDRYKLWYSGAAKNKNGVGILADNDLRDQVVKKG